MLRLILRRLGRGNWSPVVLAYDPDRQHQLPTGVEARVGAVFAPKRIGASTLAASAPVMPQAATFTLMPPLALT